MADDDISTSPGPRGPWRTPLLAGLLVLAVVVVVTAVVRSGDDDASPAAQPGGTSSSSAPSSTSASSTDPGASGASSSDPASTGAAVPSVAPGVDLDAAVRQAIKAKFPALIPSEVPAGWTITAATFRGQAWELTLTTGDGGIVGVTQDRSSAPELVARRVGSDAAPSGAVDLSRFGTGRWDGYQGPAGFGMTHAFHGTHAIVYGAAQADVVTLGQQLLTAEDADSPDGD